ncbi:MAG: AmmeMemoRadiSam system protein A [Desulfohalobiaceae bacterium]|nr:AmmeMemoRadiSam system protein A [Desulfohalobiaceae bacterium]
MQTAEDQGQELTGEQGQALVQLARSTLRNTLGKTNEPLDEEVQRVLAEPKLQQKRGTFVTLHIKDRLRGCIGCLTAEKSTVDSVRENAVNAALHDPRFPPLAARELEETHIEVSVLSEPQPLDYKDGQDLLHKLRPKVDGVILKKGMARSTFLPQVWEQLPDAKQFLSQLCLKAGLPAEAWKTEHPEILTYQAQYFEEPK